MYMMSRLATGPGLRIEIEDPPADWHPSMEGCHDKFALFREFISGNIDDGIPPGVQWELTRRSNEASLRRHAESIGHELVAVEYLMDGDRSDMLDAESATALAVKAEAHRRITDPLTGYPEHKQRFLQRNPASEECLAMYVFIDGITAASNRIEAMTPIPANFRHDGWWLPEPPVG